MFLRVLGVLMAGIVTFVSSVSAQTIATWNIANLHHETGVPLRDRASARSDDDYQRLTDTVQAVNADIWALQEIGSPAAAERVFPADQFDIYISSRYQPGDEDRPPAERDIYTAFAVKKDVLFEYEIETVEAISIAHVGIFRGEASSRPTRRAMVLQMELDGKPLEILNVHMKSSCHGWRLNPIQDDNREGNEAATRPYSSRYDCRTVKAQSLILENWIEQRDQLGKAVIVAGDFNRRLNRTFGDDGLGKEDYWAMINDDGPLGFELFKGPVGDTQNCWPMMQDTRFKKQLDDGPIDFIVWSDLMIDHLTSENVVQHRMQHDELAEYNDTKGNAQKLSDHCPVSATLQ